MPEQRFPFARAAPWDRLLGAVGLDPARAVVVLDDDGLRARFGRFEVRSAWSNVRDVTVTGPYRWFRVIGPHLSLADRGVTFGTATTAGTCVRFVAPVAGLFGSRRVHPGLTVTVDDPEALAGAIRARLADRAS